MHACKVNIHVSVLSVLKYLRKILDIHYCTLKQNAEILIAIVAVHNIICNL